MVSYIQIGAYIGSGVTASAKTIGVVLPVFHIIDTKTGDILGYSKMKNITVGKVDDTRDLIKLCLLYTSDAADD